MIVIIYLLYGTKEPLISASQYPEAPGLASSPRQSNLHQLPCHGLPSPLQSLRDWPDSLLSGDQTTRNVMTVYTATNVIRCFRYDNIRKYNYTTYLPIYLPIYLSIYLSLVFTL